MCVAGRCHDERSRPSYWLLGAVERPPSNNRVALSIWRHRWFGSLAVTHKPLDVSQHHLLREKSDFSSNLGTTILWFSEPLPLYVVVDPFFVFGDHLLQKRAPCSF